MCNDSSEKSSPLVLVDGSSYLFRAYHALPPLTNSKGMPTGAVYGVINMLRSLMKDYSRQQLIIVFDPKGKTFRHQLYPDYKANRGATPEELLIQIEPLYEIIRAMGLPLIIVNGVEADDVIGTLAVVAERQGKQVVISTGDKDMAQLVNQNISLINTMNNSQMGVKGVEEKFGVLPEQIIDYLSLMGDSSDNVPGVPKVGPKTAVKWLQQYQSLANIAEHADDIGGKVGENLRQWLAQMPLVKELITIRCDIDLSQHQQDLQLKPPQPEKLIQLFQQMEFKSWLKEQLVASESNVSSSSDPASQAISDPALFNDYVKKLKQAKQFAFDTETTSLDELSAQLVGLSFALSGEDAVYIPLAHDYAGVPAQLDRDKVLKTLKPILEDVNIKKIGQNLKYDKKVLMNDHIDLQGIAFDTMLESYVYNSTASRHDMDSLALKYLGHQCIHYEDICGKGAKQISFSQVSIEEATAYAAEDAAITYQLHNYFWPKLKQSSGLKHVFENIDMPLLAVLANMEHRGVLIDADYLHRQSHDLAARIDRLQQQTYQQAGCEFNMSSPKQLQEILFEQLKLPVLRKTPKGQPSTAEDVLQDLALDYPLPKLILSYRGLSKLKSTYTDKLPAQIHAKTGRVHTSYHQAVASTGRLSSSHPNLQNIPIKTEEGRQIRQAFIAPTGYKLLAADYSQIELRIMAHLSDDPGLKAAFSQQQDVHAATASQVFSVPLDQVNAEQRRKAKAINFGLIYGMSAFGLAKQLHVDRAVAQRYIDTYFKRYPNVQGYMEKTRQQAHDQGYVETLFGRRLYLNEINATNKMRQMAAERVAINAPMQGTAADMIKLAMIHLYQWQRSRQLDVQMTMQVHDELVFEVAEKDIEAAKEVIRQKMEHVVALSVPLVVDIGVGDNWDEAH